MTHLKNFLIKREQSQACLSFAKREKSRLLAKLMMTLALLLTAVGGAWADETLLVTIESKDYPSFKSGSMTFDDKVTVTFGAELSNDGDNWGWFSNQESDNQTITVTAASDAYTITRVKFYSANGSAFDEEAPFLAIVRHDGTNYIAKVNGTSIGRWGVNKIEVYGYEGTAAAAGPEVAWDKTSKTGTFNMPAGNVIVTPEYYPQAALTAAPTAINDVPATTDGAIVNAGTVANIGETTTAQGTVMYYVSPTALDDAALLALAADKWTADVPTAESLAQGQAYVYYYVRGNDGDTDETTFSDGDIKAANALTVTIAAEPTYAVTFADDTAEPDKWTADPAAGVKKGQQVTVTYTGTKKVIGVKAEKKAAAPAGPVTVTWNPSDIVPENPGDHSFTKDGITLTAATCDFQVLTFAGGGTFTTTLGNFTKIEISADYTGNVSGTGWSNDGWQSATWTGNAASVSFSGDIWGGGMTCSGGNLTIVFTIEK